MSSVAIVRSSYPNISTNHTRVINGGVVFAREYIWLNGHKVKIGGSLSDTARALNRHSVKTGIRAVVVNAGTSNERLKLIIRGNNLTINDPKGVFRSLQMGKNIGTSNDMLVQIICKGKVTWSYNHPTNPLTILGLISTDNIRVLNTYKDRQQVQPLVPLAEQLVPLAEELVPLAEQLAPLAEQLAPLAEELVPLAEQLVPLVQPVDRLAEQLAPLAEELVPLAEQLAPLAEELVPLAEQLVPLAEQLVPLAEQLVPLAEELVPLAEQLVPLAEQLVPLAEQLVPLAEELVPLAEELELPPILTPPSLLLLGSGYKTPPLSSSLSRYETPPLSSSVSRSYETPPLSSSLSSSYETPPRTRKIIKPSPGPITEPARKHKSTLGSGESRRDFIAQLNWLKVYDSEFMSKKYHTTKVSWSPTEKSALLARYRQVQSLS